MTEALPCVDRSWQVITSSFPHVLFESCAFAILVRIWTSSTDFRWKSNKVQHDTSLTLFDTLNHFDASEVSFVLLSCFSTQLLALKGQEVDDLMLRFWPGAHRSTIVNC